MVRLACFFVLALTLLPATSMAQGFLSELKVGALAHDVGPFTDKRETGADANLELLFASPDFLAPIWAPRPHLGGSLSTAGDTSKVYAGLTWTFDFLKVGYTDLSFGGAYHNGEEQTFDRDTKALGCHLLFRGAVEVGFRFMERHSLGVFGDHISNASLCSPNEGLESVGLRYGYRF
jgi:lipid A 3-O-deacylase